MPKQIDRSSGPKNGTILLTALFAAMGVGAMATYMARNPDARTVPADMRRVEETAHSAPPSPTESVRAPAAEAKQATGFEVRLPTLANEEVKLGDKPIKTQYPVKEIAKAALQVAGMDGIELMGADFKNGTVTLDFNAKLSEGVGSMQEGRFIDALTMGLRQIPGAERLRMFSEGKPVETLGHIEFGESVSLKEGEEPQP